MNKEFYIVYIAKGDKTNTYLYKQYMARTAREAIAEFKNEIKYKEIIKVIEWVNNKIQVVHTTYKGDILTT